LCGLGAPPAGLQMACSASNDDKNLVELFDEGFGLFQNISNCDEPTNSLNIQNKVKQAMKLFEDATRLTSMSGIFSTNESVEEVATENLRLFLLPALLGTLALKLTVANRIEVVETSDIYFRDFLQRCNDYEICNITIPPPIEINMEEIEQESGKPCGFNLMNAARNRVSKIQRYKAEKMLEEELAKLLKEVESPGVDDETKREYYTKLIKSYVSKAEEELDCLQTEKKILAYMKNAKKEEAMVHAEDHKKRVKHPPPKPLMPVIITKDEVQKAVYGLGYPSLPTMTVQEFYDKRVQDGIFPDPSKGPPSLQGMINKNTREEDDREAAEKEAKIEMDDEETLQRQRAMDEYKDDNKRGWGNRYNRS